MSEWRSKLGRGPLLWGILAALLCLGPLSLLAASISLAWNDQRGLSQSAGLRTESDSFLPVADTYLDSDFADSNYDNAWVLKIKVPNQKRPLFRFDLSSIPSGSTILSANLYLNTDYYASVPGRPLSVGAYGVNRPWVSSEATWRRASDGTPWHSEGAEHFTDRDQVPVDTALVNETNAAFSWDITDLAAEWVANPSGNYGVIMIGSEPSVEYRFYAIEPSPSTLSPRLEILYTLPVDTPTSTNSPTLTPTGTSTTTSGSDTPTPTHTPTVIATSGSEVLNPIQDASMDAYNPNSNYGLSGELKTGGVDSKRTAIKFDLSAIPSNATVTGAQLWLYGYARYGAAGTVTVNLHQLKRPWLEGEITWNRATTSTMWSQPGANDIVTDRADTAFAQFSVNDMTQWYSVNIASSAQQWVSNPSSNHGFLMIGTGDSSAELRFRSKNYDFNVTLHPRLEISYQVPLAPTSTPTATATATQTPTATGTATSTATPTATATNTSTVTATTTGTQTIMPTGTPTHTGTTTPTATATATATATPTVTATYPTATPTATGTPNAVVWGEVDLQGRPAKPHSSWAMPLQVTVDGHGVLTPQTDQFGKFLITLPPNQIYTIRVKGANTLRNVRSGVFISAGTNNVNMGTLLAGDINHSNVIDIVDFSIFRSKFGTSDAGADFNNDGWVDIFDFSLFRANYGQSGDIAVTSASK